jgi:hypothetical protein
LTASLPPIVTQSRDISREARDWAPGLDLQFHDVSSGKPIEDPGDALVILSSPTVGNVIERCDRPCRYSLDNLPDRKRC